MKYVITGVAGFIGYHLAKNLLDAGHTVVGFDNLNDYYDVNLKFARLAELQPFESFTFERLDIATPQAISRIALEQPDIIVNLAAQAGVRYSIENPQAYADSNLQGFLNVLEAARQCKPRHLLYASSSSVYGSTSAVPFSEDAEVADKPDSFYAATKRANEVMAYAYSHLYGIPATGLRFFTVYGTWGRPDMAVYKFALAMKEGRPIPVFGDGSMRRDFTFVEDTAQAVAILSNIPPTGENPHRVVNVGNRNPESVLGLITLLEKKLGLGAPKEYLPIPAGDVPVTYADTSKLENLTGYTPDTSLEKGIEVFAKWFKQYHG